MTFWDICLCYNRICNYLGCFIDNKVRSNVNTLLVCHSLIYIYGNGKFELEVHKSKDVIFLIQVQGLPKYYPGASWESVAPG